MDQQQAECINRHVMRQMSPLTGDGVVAEWNETTEKVDMDKFEADFNSWLARGGVAADLTTNELIREFKPGTDILLIPKFAGGRS